MDVTWIDGDLALHWPWLVAALALLVAALLVAWVRPWRRRTPSEAAYVAHAERLSRLPRFRALVRQQVWFGALASIALLIALAGAITLAGRVEQQRTLEQDSRARDVVLCLDASGSMAEYNTDVLREMRAVVAGLDGERVGLAIWSKATITIFPLTDDYAFAQQRLDEAIEAFSGIEGILTSDGDMRGYLDYVAGTQRLDGSATIVSQIGDGLASCVQRFGDLDTDRGRAIILSSDNEPYGKGIYTLGEAADLAIDSGVVVHGIGTRGFIDRPEHLADFERAVTRTGGIFGRLDGTSSAADLVTEINTLEAAKVDEPPVVQTIDRPLVGTVVTGLGLGLFVLVLLVRHRVTAAGRRGR